MAITKPLPKLTVGTTEITVAPLETINLRKLQAKDSEEIKRLVESCKQPGFFYLDLNDDPAYVQSLDSLYGLGGKYFAQPEAVKMADYRDSQDRGYKPGEAETFEIARDELTSKSPIPPAMSDSKEMVESFIATSHGITMTMLSLLAEALNMPHLLEHHLESRPSDSGLKIESVPFEERLEDVPPSEHTDEGTLTLLFCAHYTTELRVPGTTDDWAFIVPKPGHAIVNVANSLQRLAGQQLLSCLHRVGQPVPVTGPKDRVCALYYLRPATADAA